MSSDTAISRSRYSVVDFIIIAIALAALFGTVPFASLILQVPGTGSAGDRPAPGFELRDARGELRTLEEFRGRTVFMIFGYLRCSDICHSQVANLVALADQLQTTDSVFLYLAMDSRRDDPAALHEYFDKRGQEFYSLHAADTAAMQSIANAYLAGYRIAGNPASDSYTIEHPARIFMIGPGGRIRHSYAGINPDVHLITDDFYRINSET